MTHTYEVTGMTCGHCEANVKSSLLKLPNITAVEVSKEKQTAVISMDQHIPLAVLQQALDKKYAIAETEHNETAEQTKSWLAAYKPLLLIFGYITTVALIAATAQGGFNQMQGMNVFMAGFFLTFSFFKMLNLSGFADSYAMYDIVAKRMRLWGFIYPFIELLLGIAYALNFQPFITNSGTLIVMGVSIIGVLQSVFNKRKIQCACLGAVFNLPMSSVTIIEDALMIAMSAGLLVSLL
ncbi:MAG: heavy metal transporter [Ferruginibacter sp.]|uniref:heavy-metal-associated domain-containing protein n=1 Tax=Ferruginibacter sp. TaxID=1940288 RepID=UPI002659E127|nr:cation transporter [Ferruginibacter sp.]MDB5279181.1 heavy metal transporter [Ferruginibacter sp.]